MRLVATQSMPFEANPIRRAMPAILGLALLLAVTGCRERNVTPPSATPAPTEVGGGPSAAPQISARCAVPWQIAQSGSGGASSGESDADGGDWQAVQVLEPDSCFELQPAGADSRAPVAPDSTFTFTSSDDIGADSLAALLEVQPPVVLEVAEASQTARAAGPARTLTQADTRTFSVSPSEPLEEGESYAFTLHETPGGRVVQRWAFAVSQPLAVVASVPGDSSTDVPLDAGIELTFNSDVNSGVPEAATIEPELEGRWESRGRTWVFIPDELTPMTLYTLRLDSGLSGASGDSLAAEFVLQFETGSADSRETPPGIEFGHPMWESPSDERPALSVFRTGGSAPSTDDAASVTVHAYSDLASFRDALDRFVRIPDWAWATRQSYRTSTSGLESVLSAEVTLQAIGEFGELVVELPDELDRGYYLVTVELDNATAQAWLQVSDLAAYAVASEDGSLVWVHDLVDGEPFADAEILFGDQVVGETDDDGLARFSTPPGAVEVGDLSYGNRMRSAAGAFLVSTGDRQTLIPLDSALRGFRNPGLREFRNVGRADDFWRFLYTDRHLYRLNDSVHAWGILKDRIDPESGLNVTIEIAGSGFEGFGNEEVIVARRTIQTSDAGTFTVELPYEKASPGFYTLRATIDDEVIASTYMEIRDFVTPAYRIEISPQPLVALAGDTVTYTVEAQFFEGSPVPSLALRTFGETEEVVETDSRGIAQLVRENIGVRENVRETDYSWIDATVQPVLEEAEIIGSGAALVFPAALGLELTSERGDDDATLSGAVYAIDLDAVIAAEGDPTVARGGGVEGVDIEVDVTEITYEREQVGTRYDYIAKEVVPEYTYNEVRSPGPSLEATSGEGGEFEISFDTDEDVSYEVEVTIEDEAGRVRTSRVWIWGGRALLFQQGLTLTADDDGPFSVGDEVTLRLENLQSTEGSFLFVQARNGLLDTTITDSAAYSFEFDADDVPNVVVAAAQFTGRTYHEVSFGYIVDFDETDRELQVEIESGEPAYAPGDEATVTALVTGPDGEPVTARLLLSVVDEAALSARGIDQGDLTLLRSLYQTVGSGILATYASHQVPLGRAGAEGGGGDGGRDVFKDIVLFEEVETDADGRAEATFALPDNLTSWRVAALAVTDDLSAGAGMGSVIVKLPFFVDVTMNETYLTADRPEIRVRGFGDSLDADDVVDFNVEVPGLGIDIAVEAPAFEPATVDLGELVAGDYELTVSGSADGAEDAIVRRFQVLPSRLMATRATRLELAEGESVTGAELAESESGSMAAAQGRLVVTDLGRGRYYPALRDLVWSYGDRLDQALARSIAADLLVRYFEQSATLPVDFHVGTYLVDQGLALLPYSSPDVELTALAVDVGGGEVGAARYRPYFNEVAGNPDSTPELASAAAYGLAASGEPAFELLEALRHADGNSLRGRLYVALGFAALGDEARAAEDLAAILSDAGERRGEMIRVAADDADETLVATALAAQLAGRLGSPVGADLFAFISETPSDVVETALGQAGFLRSALERLPSEPVTVAVSIDGETEERTLERGAALNLSLTAQDLSVQVVEGHAAVAVSALAPLDLAGSAAAGITVVRDYGNVEDRTGVEAAQDVVDVAGDAVVQVTLDFEVEDPTVGCYQLTDLLPSGLKPVTRPEAAFEYVDPASEVQLPYAVTGQRVSFCVSPETESEIRYLARVVGTGSYLAEPALLQSLTAFEDYALSEPMRVEIR